MITFILRRQSEDRISKATPKKTKSKKKYARKEIFLQSTRSLKPTKTLDRVSIERDPQIN